MKYVLIWLAISSTGSITSGAASFEDKDACQNAGSKMLVNSADILVNGMPGFKLIYECEPARSGP